MINLYADVTSKSFKGMKIYNSNILFDLISGFLKIYVQISLWLALYRNGGNRNTTLEQAITYSVILVFLIKQCYLRVADSISDSVYNGEIEINLLRPASPTLMFSFNALGKNLFHLVFFSMPIFILINIIYKIVYPQSLTILLFFLISFLLGQIIFALLECILGYTAFWLKTNWYVVWIEITVMNLFGGNMIPLWFYPSWLADICKYMPFQYVGYDVINIYLGKYTNSECFEIILIQFLWIICLFIIGRVVWSRAKKKVEIYGG